jgi:hypothetical protein|tara:strand:+ start:530 stop:712 length:183 start_codon:yes stop_codon:yes gene_type:complete
MTYWTRVKLNKDKVLKHVKEKAVDTKQMNLFKELRKEVNIGDNGTQRYVVKKGKNKGKIL